MSTEIAGDTGEPTAAVPRTAWRASNHLRRYMPLYVFGTLWALMLALLPTVTHDGSNNTNQVGAFGPGGSPQSRYPSPGAQPVDPSGAGGLPPGAATPSGGAAPAPGAT